MFTGGIVTCAVDTTQHVAVASGNVSRGTFDTRGSPRITVLALDAPDEDLHSVALPEANGPAGQPEVTR